MLYKQDIANLALGHLGVSSRVMDYDNENTLQAKIIRAIFKNSLNKVLAKYEWGFTTQFAALALQEEAPISGYGFSYALPADCLVLRLIAMDGMFPKVKNYDQEKQKFRNVYNGSGPRIIYTDIPRAWGEYTTELPVNNAFPDHFGEGLSHQLALDIAPQLITNSFAKVKQSLMDTAKNEVTLAISIDIGMEPPMEDAPGPFLAARLV